MSDTQWLPFLSNMSILFDYAKWTFLIRVGWIQKYSEAFLYIYFKSHDQTNTGKNNYN